MRRNLHGIFIAMMVGGVVSSGTAWAVSRVVPGVTDNNSDVAMTENVGVSRTNTNTRGAVLRDTANVTDNENSGTTSRTAVRRTVPGLGQNSSNVTTTASTVGTVATPSRTASRSSVVNVGAAAASTAARATSSGAMRAAVRNGEDVSARDKLEATVNTVGRNSRIAAASINGDPAVRRAGLTLRPSTADVGGRAIIGDTGQTSGSNIASEIRNLQSRAAVTTRETIAQARERMEQTAELNQSCQQQYNDCMDQFCAVVDANQKRCSCSSNLARYTKVENAVKDANVQLNEVAQRIRYVGLSADEIRAIMSATEAEEALAGVRDTTQTRSMLEDIEDMIKNPSSSTSSAPDTYSSWLDMDLDFSSDSSNLFSVDFFGGDTNSFSNLRGTQLYNAAKKRCKSILTQCKEVGATEAQITGNYDLAIDKDCIAYEQGLTKMNETLVSNVRSANNMLQKARLAVLQNKNQYGAKECIAALDTCMKDDMVCGADYEKCLDPTKRYIDENGNVVLGQDITAITSMTEDYTNVSTAADIANLTCNVSNAGTAGTDGKCVIWYLMQKIGTGPRAADNGLCRAVLDKCQNYTYNKKGDYQPYNDVVLNYIQRAMVNIKAAQTKIISDYAADCVMDIATCYNQQVSQVNTWSSSASAASVQRVMRGACRNVALTCAYAVFKGSNQISQADSSYVCRDTGEDGSKQYGTLEHAQSSEQECLIENISEMFYQSLLCPDNSQYAPGYGTEKYEKETIGVGGKWANTACRCVANYYSTGSSCVYCPDVGQSQSINASGQCVCANTATVMKDDGSACQAPGTGAVVD